MSATCPPLRRLAYLVLLPALAASAAMAQGGALVNPPACPAGFVYEIPPALPGIIVLDTGRTAASNLPPSQADIIHVRSCADAYMLTLGSGECACKYGDPITCPLPSAFSFPYTFPASPKPNCSTAQATDNGLSIQGCTDLLGQGRLSIDLDIDYDIANGQSADVILKLAVGAINIPADMPSWDTPPGPGRGCLDNGVVVDKNNMMTVYRVQLSIVPDGIAPIHNAVIYDGETENYSLKTWRVGSIYWAQLENDDQGAFPPMQCTP